MRLSRNEPISFPSTNLVWIELIGNLKKHYWSDFDEADSSLNRSAAEHVCYRRSIDKTLLVAYLGKKTEARSAFAENCISIMSQICRSCPITLSVACNGYLDSRSSPNFALPNTDIRWLGPPRVCVSHGSFYSSRLIQTTFHLSCVEPFAIPSGMEIICPRISVAHTTYSDPLARWTTLFPCATRANSWRSENMCHANFP